MTRSNRSGLAQHGRRLGHAALGAAFAFSLAAFFPSGCATPPATSHAGEKYIVSAPHTLFYKFGPAQPNGPDFSLSKGQQLTMLGYQYGYSHVATEDGQAGYVASDDLVPAPAPVATPTPVASPTPGKSAGLPHYRGRAPTRDEEALLPPPDLPGAAQPRFRY